MATYLDGMDGGKHNSDNTENSVPKKKKYTVRQEAPATQYWYYEVEAESEEEAVEIVMQGELDAIDYTVESDEYFGVQDTYEIIDEEEIK